MKEIFKTIVVILILGLITTMCATSVCGQDSIKVDKALLEKINYMAWKSRQLDTLYNICNKSYAGIQQSLIEMSHIVDTLTYRQITLQKINQNLALQNKLEKSNWKQLQESNASITKYNLKLLAENEELKFKNKKLKSQKNRGTISNIVLATLLGVTMYAIIKDDDD